MVDLITNIIGYSATVAATLVMIPQLIKSLKTKQVEGISIIMLVMMMINSILWVTYGILIKGLPVTIANSIGFLVVFAEFILKIKYNPKKKK